MFVVVYSVTLDELCHVGSSTLFVRRRFMLMVLCFHEYLSMCVCVSTAAVKLDVAVSQVAKFMITFG